MSSTLKERITRMIRASGPISVATYMDLCLHDRQHGYYATRPGLGEDFITAPETSQIFGELIGLWAAHEWQQMGSPERFSLIEIGPGRGTLMADVLRATKAVPGFQAAMRLSFIEASPVLRTNLERRFAADSPEFLPGLEALAADCPILLIANEWPRLLVRNWLLRLCRTGNHQGGGLSRQRQRHWSEAPCSAASASTGCLSVPDLPPPKWYSPRPFNHRDQIIGFHLPRRHQV